MTLRTLKRKCEQIQEGVPGLLEQLMNTYNSRSERWKNSDKGKNMRIDINRLHNLFDAVESFIGSSEEE